MAKLVAKTYAQALFEFAQEAGRIEDIRTEFDFVGETLTTYKEFFELVKTPKLSIDERKAILVKVFGEKISSEMMNFLMIILDKRRAGELLSIHREFALQVDAHLGIEEAFVTSATALDEAEKDALVANLVKLTGKKIRLRTGVDPSVIGGVYIKVGDKVIDGSLRNKLELMKEELRQIIV